MPLNGPQRVKRLESLLERIVPVPEVWLTRAKEEKRALEKLKPLPCKDWKVLINAWKKAMKWIPGLDYGLSVMLACVLSTEAMGDQLWVQILSPPSSGKTTVAEAIGVEDVYTFTITTMTNLYSGYKSDKEGSEDFSLAAKIKNKTLIIKEADPILKLPNREVIFSQLRDLYDTQSQTHYGQGAGRKYDQRSSIIMCGTGAMREVDTADLGARFLTCSIMDKIDEELEDDIAFRGINSTVENMANLVNGRAEERLAVEMTRAKQLTAGFVQHLRTNTVKLLAKARDSFDDATKRECVHLAKFVSHMRARPSVKQGEVVERELSVRLVKQIGRMAGCLAGVMGRAVDKEVMRRVRQVAVDTARGRTMRIAQALYSRGVEGMDRRSLAWVLGEEKEREFFAYIHFLAHENIGVLERFQAENDAGMRYRLTHAVYNLYREVMCSGGLEEVS